MTNIKSNYYPVLYVNSESIVTINLTNITIN